MGDEYRNAGLPERQGALPAGRVGVVVLATDHAIESELWRMFGRSGLDLYVSRVPSTDAYDEDSLAATARHLSDAASLILPGSRLDALAFGCTSATIAFGEGQVLERLGAIRPGVPCTTPITAAKAAFRALGASRLALLTPYIRPVHERVRCHLESSGLTVVSDECLARETDSAITAVPGGELAEAIRFLGQGGRADAIFVSCTALRIVDRIAALERMTGLPVVTSNQALAWHCLRLAGNGARPRFAGRLLRVDRLPAEFRAVATG